MKNTHVRANLFALVLLTGLGCFLLFNYATTYETLGIMLGRTTNVTLFAVAVSMVDFAGLARVLTPNTSMKDEGVFVYVLLGVWLVAAAVDIILTWWWVALRMETVNAGQYLPPGVGAWMTEVFPWAVAFMEFAIRVPLVLLVGQYGDKILEPFKRTSFARGGPVASSMAPKQGMPPIKRPIPVPTGGGNHNTSAKPNLRKI